MGKYLNIAGERYGRLIAVERLSVIGKAEWECKCDCGKYSVVSLSNLRSGLTKSCGCLRSENAVNQSIINSDVKSSKKSIQKRIEKMSVPEPNSGCWLWIGSIDKKGYGHTALGSGKTISASRMSYYAFKCESTNELMSSNEVVRHTCDVRMCVNPDHLLIGSQKENIKDMYLRGRARPRGRIPASP